MKISKMSSVLITKDFEKMKQFYLNVLEQEIENDFGNCIGFKCGIAIWELKPEYPLAGRLGRTFSASDNENLELCFEIDDFEETVEKLRRHSLDLLHDVVEETWGQKTIRFYDPDRNLIEVGETVPGFIRRLVKEGMTADQAAEKSSLPLELVRTYLNTGE